MPFWPLTLTKRLVLAVKLTPAQVDQNWTDIENAVNADHAALSVALNPDGTLKNNSVSTAAIQDRAVTINKRAFLSNFYVVDTGVANALVVSFGALPLSAYAAGVVLYVKAAVTNTTATTIEVDGLAPRAIRKYSGSGLVDVTAGEIQAAGIYEIVDDGVQFIVLNPTSASASPGPVFLPLEVALNPGGTAPVAWTDVDLSLSAIPATAKAVILQCVNQVLTSDGEVLTEVKPDNAGSIARVACQMGGVAGTGTEASQQGIYPIGLVAGVPHIWYRVTITSGAGSTAFISLTGYVL